MYGNSPRPPHAPMENFAACSFFATAYNIKQVSIELGSWQVFVQYATASCLSKVFNWFQNFLFMHQKFQIMYFDTSFAKLSRSQQKMVHFLCFLCKEAIHSRLSKNLIKVTAYGRDLRRLKEHCFLGSRMCFQKSWQTGHRIHQLGS